MLGVVHLGNRHTRPVTRTASREDIAERHADQNQREQGGKQFVRRRWHTKSIGTGRRMLIRLESLCTKKSRNF
jgi:hypothetical protein